MTTNASPLTIVREHDAPRGRYVAQLEDGLEAVLVYRDADGVRMIEHTGTPAALRGKGVAGRLTAQAMDDARQEGMRVFPQCSYALAWLKRHNEFSDIVVNSVT